MINKQKLIAIFSTLSGIILTLMGMLGIGFYLYSGLTSLDQPDKSGLFWFLPFLFIGIILVGGGVYFFIIGIRSRKGDKSDYMLAKVSIIIFSILIIIVIAIGIVNSI
jgi:heme/copper-type cytochrome/quinol oxidase subunit 1